MDIKKAIRDYRIDSDNVGKAHRFISIVQRTVSPNTLSKNDFDLYLDAIETLLEKTETSFSNSYEKLSLMLELKKNKRINYNGSSFWQYAQKLLNYNFKAGVKGNPEIDRFINREFTVGGMREHLIPRDRVLEIFLWCYLKLKDSFFDHFPENEELYWEIFGILNHISGHQINYYKLTKRDSGPYYNDVDLWAGKFASQYRYLVGREEPDGWRPGILLERRKGLKGKKLELMILAGQVLSKLSHHHYPSGPLVSIMNRTANILEVPFENLFALYIIERL